MAQNDAPALFDEEWPHKFVSVISFVSLVALVAAILYVLHEY